MTAGSGQPASGQHNRHHEQHGERAGMCASEPEDDRGPRGAVMLSRTRRRLVGLRAD